MYKPSLKRTLDFNPFKKNIMEEQIPFKTIEPISKRLDPAHLMVPIKMLETPDKKSNEKSYLFTPLAVQNHKYPKKIEELIKNAAGEASRGIGGYREVNWYFQEQKVNFWLSGKDYEEQFTADSSINCMALGQLKGCKLPSKIKNRYVFAIASNNLITLYSLNNFTLAIQSTGITYKLNHAISIEKLKFVEGNKLVAVGDTGHVMIIQFGQNEGKKTMNIPFYMKFIPGSVNQVTYKVETFIYTNKKIYVLLNELRTKGWFRSAVENIFQGQNDPIMRSRYIQIYEIEQNKINKGAKINQEELNRKVKQYMPNWQGNFELQTIYLDKSNDKEGQLGIVTSCGCFFSLRNNNFNLSRQPLFMPNTNQLGECQLISEQKLEYTHNPNDQQKKNTILYSLGYDNLTLMDDALLYIGDRRIDGVVSSLPMGQIVQKTQYCHQNLVEKTRQWGVYTFNGYFTIKRLPLRHFVATLLYLRSNITNQYMGLHYNSDKFDKVIEKYIKIISPETFLRLLIEIIISEEKYITVNQYFISLIESELKDEKPKHFKDWPYALESHNIIKVEIHLKQRVMQQIWFMILQLQHRFVANNFTKSGQGVYQSNNLWITMKDIYHELVSPIFGMNPDKFKANNYLIEDIGDSIVLIQKFFEEKDKYERSMRGLSIIKQQSHRQSELDITDSSIKKQYEMTWISEQAKRSIVTRSLNDHHSVLEEKIKNAFQATGMFLMVYYNMEDYLCRSKGKNLETYIRPSIPSFKELLSSRQQQRFIKKILLAQVHFEHLSELNKRMPLFNLEKDLQFMKCREKINMEDLPKDKINLDQLAQNISSDYFEDIDKIFKDRLDLKLKVLGLYQQKLSAKKLALIPSNTLKQRSLMAKTSFPEDQEQILRYKRAYLDKQFELTLEQQENCITKIVCIIKESRQKKVYQKLDIFERTLIFISQKPHLIHHMEQQLRANCLTRQLSQIERIKPPSEAFFRQDTARAPRGYVKRQLFPRPSYI